MKKLIQFALVFVLCSSPLFAKTTTVTIPEDVTAGSTHISAGDYKVAYEGSGPAVKVTLKDSRRAPIVLDAKLITGGDHGDGVLLGKVNGVRVLLEVELGSSALVFETPQTSGN